MDEGPCSEHAAQLTGLARDLESRGLITEAGDLFALAVHLDAGCGAAREGLERTRQSLRSRRKPHADGRRHRTASLRDTVQEEFRRTAIDGAHYLGLAHLYAQKDNFPAAVECLEAAQERAPAHPGHHKLLGAVLFRRKDFDGAVAELERALRLDPFDREVAEMLGLAESERRRFAAAAAATAHAFLLLPGLDSDAGARLRRRLLTLKRILRWESSGLQQLFRERREILETAVDRLAWHREHLLEEEYLPPGGALFGTPPPRNRRGLIDLASRLRRLEVLAELSDEQLFELAGVVQEELHDRGSLIFAQGGPGRDLYLIERGEVTLQRPTSYGNYRLRVLAGDELLGEVGFLSDESRANDAVASAPASLLRVDREQLEGLLGQHPELGAQLLWSMWYSLARKLRSSNEQLRRIFAGVGAAEAPLAGRLGREQGGERVTVDPREKRKLFAEQGLSHHELMTLATFSREKRFAEGEYLFHEGDAGDELYVIVDGRALISKFIPGGGDEALAILGRGEFFGEMALIDGRPRSADARAHEGPLTVLALDGKTIRELLTLDAAASLQFLRLLCRMMARRLAEIDDKVVTWQILDGYREHQETPAGR